MTYVTHPHKGPPPPPGRPQRVVELGHLCEVKNLHSALLAIDRIT